MQERQIKPELEMNFDSVFRVRANHEISLFQSPMIFPELYWGISRKKKEKKSPIMIYSVSQVNLTQMLSVYLFFCDGSFEGPIS